MTEPIRTTSLLVRAAALVIMFLPSAARAQAGLHWEGPSADEIAARNSQFDKTFQSKSALGQLEEMTGTTVDRSSSQRTTVTRVAPRPAPVTPRLNFNQEVKLQVAGALADALVGMLFSDNSAQQRAAAEAAAAQAAAQAAAEAEAFRVQQELARQARIRQAQHYRADWDSREGEITDRLGGAFDVTASTGFFGRPANPDADTVAAILGQGVGPSEKAPGEAPDVSESDPSVVDLRGSSLVVQPFDSPAQTFTPGRVPAVTRSPTQARVLPRLVDEGPEGELTPDHRSIGEWWTKWHPYVRRNAIDAEINQYVQLFDSLGADKVLAFGSFLDKARSAVEIKERFGDHIDKSMGRLFGVMGQMTDPNANWASLDASASGDLVRNVSGYQDIANRGISDNLVTNFGGAMPEGFNPEAAVASSQKVMGDLQDLLCGTGDAPGTP
jgi:hypothetical protein